MGAENRAATPNRCPLSTFFLGTGQTRERLKPVFRGQPIWWVAAAYLLYCNLSIGRFNDRGCQGAWMWIVG